MPHGIVTFTCCALILPVCTFAENIIRWAHLQQNYHTVTFFLEWRYNHETFQCRRIPCWICWQMNQRSNPHKLQLQIETKSATNEAEGHLKRSYYVPKLNDVHAGAEQQNKFRINRNVIMAGQRIFGHTFCGQAQRKLSIFLTSLYKQE